LAYASQIAPLEAEEQLRWLTTQHAKEPERLAKELSKAAGWTAAAAGSGLAGFMATPTLAKHVTVLTPEQLAAEIAGARGQESGGRSQGTGTPG
jgi:hypothetical protein